MLRGFYERLVEIVKNSLKKILRKSKFNYIEVSVILQEAKFVINSPPLTYLNEDCFKKSLKPYHIIHGQNISNHCDEEIQSNNVTGKCVQNVCKHTNVVLKHFIQRFKNESRDNNVRAVELNVYQSNSSRSFAIRRPIQRLVPLEIQNEIQEIQQPDKENENESKKQERLRRAAALNPDILRRICHESN